MALTKRERLTQQLQGARVYISFATGLQTGMSHEKLESLRLSLRGIVHVRSLPDFVTPIITGSVAALVKRSGLSKISVLESLREAHALCLNSRSFLILPTRGDVPRHFVR